MATVQEAVDAIQYTQNTTGLTQTPPNCNTFDCQVFDELRAICKANGININYLISFQNAQTVLQKLNQNKFPQGWISASEIGQFLIKGGFSSSSSLSYDELCCVVKICLTKVLGCALPKESVDYNLEQEAEDAMNFLGNYLGSQKCKNYQQDVPLL